MHSSRMSMTDPAIGDPQICITTAVMKGLAIHFIRVVAFLSVTRYLALLE
jgi:hypothetical protein